MQVKKINEKHVRIVEKKDITELHVNSTRTSVIYLFDSYLFSFKIALHLYVLQIVLYIRIIQ